MLADAVEAGEDLGEQQAGDPVAGEGGERLGEAAQQRGEAFGRGGGCVGHGALLV